MAKRRIRRRRKVISNTAWNTTVARGAALGWELNIIECRSPGGRLLLLLLLRPALVPVACAMMDPLSLGMVAMR